MGDFSKTSANEMHRDRSEDGDGASSKVLTAFKAVVAIAVNLN